MQHFEVDQEICVHRSPKLGGLGGRRLLSVGIQQEATSWTKLPRGFVAQHLKSKRLHGDNVKISPPPNKTLGRL